MSLALFALPYLIFRLFFTDGVYCHVMPIRCLIRLFFSFLPVRLPLFLFARALSPFVAVERDADMSDICYYCCLFDADAICYFMKSFTCP